MIFNRLKLFALLTAVGLTACHRLPTSVDLLSKDPVVRTKATEKLAQIEEAKKGPLVEPLILALQDQDPQINQYAVDALVLIGNPAVTSLTVCLKDPKVFVRLCAVDALGRIGPASDSSVPTLAMSLDDPHPLVQEGAQIALQKIGTPDALGALPSSSASKKKKTRV